MNIRITWEDNNILRYDFPEIWSWDELFKAQIYAQSLINQSTDKPVGVILNLPHNTVVPPQAVGSTHQILERLHTLVDVIVVVGGNTIVSALVNVVNRTHWREKKRSIYMNETLDEARLFIAQKLNTNANNGS